MIITFLEVSPLFSDVGRGQQQQDQPLNEGVVPRYAAVVKGSKREKNTKKKMATNGPGEGGGH